MTDAPPLPQKKSSAPKWLLGCGGGCMVVITLCVVAGTLFFRSDTFKEIQKQVTHVVDEIKAIEAEYDALGYQKVSGQVITIDDDVSGSTFYKGQVVKLMGDHNGHLAILAQMTEIHGKVSGDVEFTGQMLVIQQGAVIEGNLNATAQDVQIHGEVKGEVSRSMPDILK